MVSKDGPDIPTLRVGGTIEVRSVEELSVA